MNKLAVIVPFYKRRELTKLCFKRLLSQSKRLGFDVVVCGSEGKTSRALSKGLKYIERENILGTKLNALLSECKSYDGVILLGSDDFISDSVIKMYQEIDATKEVYYSFNDVYVYSARLKKVVSDLEYTRQGNGIGVGRMFTKPTLEKCNYTLWHSDKLRGCDRDAATTLSRKGIKEVLLDLGDLFVIDIKLEYNLTPQDIVNSGHKQHALSIIPEYLGAIGNEILELSTQDIEHVKWVKPVEIKTPMKKIKVIVLISFERFEKGNTYELKEHNYKALSKAGFVEKFKEAPIKPEAKKFVPKSKGKKQSSKK